MEIFQAPVHLSSPRITRFPLEQFLAYVLVSVGIPQQLNLKYGPTNAIFA